VLPGAKPSPPPVFIAPTLATACTKLATGPGYIHEYKFDGYRMQVHLRDGRLTLYSRNALEWTNGLPTIAQDLAHLPARALVLDGEVIAAVEEGRADLNALQDDLKRGRRDRLAYHAFDLLHLDGFDLRGAPSAEPSSPRRMDARLASCTRSISRTARRCTRLCARSGSKAS
jgi:bifunctional non-homologous end joining protein LigD